MAPFRVKRKPNGGGSYSILGQIMTAALIASNLQFTPAVGSQPEQSTWIGVPAPMWGATNPLTVEAPAHPGAWPSAQAVNYYYIDNTHPQATDTANTYGYPNKPRVSIPTTYSAGAYVEIAAGTYTGSQLIITATGTEAQPVWIRGSSSVTPPIINREIILKGSYIYLENIKKTTQNSPIGLRSHSNSHLHHACVRNCELVGTSTAVGSTSGIQMNGLSGNRFYDLIAYNNHIHDLGDHTPEAAENDYHGITVSSHVDRAWVLNNHVHHMGGDSIQIGFASGPDENRPSHVYIAGNTFHDDHENAVDIKEANNVIASQNTMYGYEYAASGGGAAVIVHNNAINVWMIANRIYACENGIVCTGASGMYSIANVISGSRATTYSGWNPDSEYSDGAGLHYRATTDGHIIGNTIDNCDIGMSFANGGPYVLENNILSNRNRPEANDIIIANSTVGGVTAIDNNLHDNMRIKWATTTGITSVSGLVTASGGKGGNSVIGDEAFNPGEYSLSASSAALNTGKASDVYATFNSLYGIDIQKDYAGVSRPVGLWDIGAYERAV